MPPIRMPPASHPIPNSGPVQGAPMQDIQLRLSIDELNLILEGIGNLPFARVFALVGKIQAQAAEQLQAAQGAQGGASALQGQG